MGDPFTDVTVLNYNDDAPADDGTAVPANEVKWSTVTAELANPLKTAVESLVTNTGAAFDKVAGGVTAQAAPYTIVAGDQGKLVRVTSAGTITSATAATVGSPFEHGLLNDSGGTVTFDGAGSETVDGQANITLPDGAGVWVNTDGTNWYTAGRGNIQGASSYVTPLPRGYIGGLQISNGTDTDHDIDIAVGTARDSANSFNFSLTSAFTKQIDASWAAGSAAGGFPTGISLSANTWYHVFLVDDGSGNTDAGFDTSTTATNLLADSGGTLYRRIGSVLTDGTNNILAFTQVGDEFIWADPPLDLNTGAATTTAANATLSTPLGYKTLARCNLRVEGGVAVYVSSPDANDEAPATSDTAPLSTIHDNANNTNAWASVMTNTSSQVRYRADGVNKNFEIATLGWQDFLGRWD